MKTNAKQQNAMTGTYGTFLFGGALQLFKWDSGKQVQKGSSALYPTHQQFLLQQECLQTDTGF